MRQTELSTIRARITDNMKSRSRLVEAPEGVPTTYRAFIAALTNGQGMYEWYREREQAK